MITVVGSSNTDLVIKTEHLPKMGQTILGRDYVIASGGKGANQAVACARLGHKVAFIGCIGKDHFGDVALASMVGAGVDTRFVVRDKEHPSGLALIVVDKDGHNIIAVSPGSNHQLKVKDVTRAEEVIVPSEILLLQLEIPLSVVKKAASMAHSNGVRVILNPAPACKLEKSLLSKVDYLTPNETEVEILTGVKAKDRNSMNKAGNILLQQGVGYVIITLGQKGSYILSKDLEEFVPALKVKSMDTTCAGDAFSAALAIALGEGRHIVEAVRFANRVAALCIRKMGAQPSLPSRREVEGW